MDEDLAILDLYNAKQVDNNNAASKDDFARFTHQVKSGIRNRELDISSQHAALILISRIPKFLRYFNKIKYINFYGNLIRDEGLTRVCTIILNNPTITKLNVGSNDLSDGSALGLANLIDKANIEALQLGRRGQSFLQNWLTRDGLVTIIESVIARNTLKCFGIAGIGSMKQKKTQKWREFPTYIANMIKKCTNMVTLDLTDSGFNSLDHERVIARGLRENKTLKHLNLSGNKFSPGDVIMHSICGISSLISLDMSNCGLCESSCVILSKMLTGRYSLKLVSLNISSNPIGTDGIKYLLSCLSNNIYLTTLNISDTQCNHEIKAKLELLLSKNETIDDIDLSKNNFGDGIAEIVGYALENGDVLRRLNISSTRLTDEGGMIIANACIRNKSLRSINMSDNFFTKQVGYDLLDVFQQNETLHNINLSANQIDCFALSGFTTLCARNKNAKSEKEIGELRKKYIHLSIQNSKIPAHNTKLQNVQLNNEEVKEELGNMRKKIENLNVEQQINIKKVESNIEEIEKMIVMQQENIEKTEKAHAEFKTTHQLSKKKLLDDIAVQTQRFQNYQHATEKANKEIDEIEMRTEMEKASLQKEIEEAEKLLEEVKGILEDDDNIVDVVIPEYPYDDDRKPIIIPINMLRAKTSSAALRSSHAESKKSKRPKSGKKAKIRKVSPKKGKKKGKSKK